MRERIGHVSRLPRLIPCWYILFACRKLLLVKGDGRRRIRCPRNLDSVVNMSLLLLSRTAEDVRIIVHADFLPRALPRSTPTCENEANFSDFGHGNLQSIPSHISPAPVAFSCGEQSSATDF